MRIRSAVLTLLAGSLTLAGCGSNPDAPVGNLGLPGWVMQPEVEDGLAETACVPFSGHLSIDKQQATAMARSGIAQQISVKVKAMDKVYNRRTDTAGGRDIGANFESVSKQVTERSLTGTKATKTDIFDIDRKRQLCTMVTLEPEKTKAVFENILADSGRQLDPQDEAVLYEEFRAAKAQQELEKELSR
ncbi:hypothetical protein HXX02_09465 [Microbulbifer elongatus]|uniref:LPP20 lipoprotein n=1 Tax=Microbulbifer elongatus TaxID=86173 RepID=A0ABT1P0M6_9GAMM|nr:LPP20 family lipoprotein [Microbulbifer elongatus]MCQ3829674.1 hypothetical protein [Microbulbifer elongatus]